MERRAFLTVAGAIAAPYQTRNAMLGHLFRVPTSAFPVIPAQEPTLAPEVFASRVERAQAELNSRKLDCLIATPSTNYEYFTGYNPGRSERLIRSEEHTSELQSRVDLVCRLLLEKKK